MLSEGREHDDLTMTRRTLTLTLNVVFLLGVTFGVLFGALVGAVFL